jgi:hypothetical protein
MYALVMGGAYPYMDLNEWLEKLMGVKDKYI